MTKNSVIHFSEPCEGLHTQDEWRVIIFLKPDLFTFSSDIFFLKYILFLNESLHINFVKGEDYEVYGTLKGDNSKAYYRHWIHKQNIKNQLIIVENKAYAHKESEALKFKNPNLFQIEKKSFLADNVKKKQFHYFNNIALFFFIKGFNQTYPDDMLDDCFHEKNNFLKMLPIEKIGSSLFLESILYSIVLK